MTLHQRPVLGVGAPDAAAPRHRGAFTIGVHSPLGRIQHWGAFIGRDCPQVLQVLQGHSPWAHFLLRGGAVDLLAQGRPLVGPSVGRGASPSPGNELGRGAGEDIPAERALGLGVLRPLCCAGLNAPFLHALGPPCGNLPPPAEGGWVGAAHRDWQCLG